MKDKAVEWNVNFFVNRDINNNLSYSFCSYQTFFKNQTYGYKLKVIKITEKKLIII